MKAIGFVFARGGSKGLPRKNVLPVGGVPMIGRAIDAALGSKYIDRVVVSTDDDEIAAVAEAHGGEVPFRRPKDLSGDGSPEILAWQHAIGETKRQSGESFDLFVSVPATSPLRISEDVDACIERYLKGDVDLVVAVTEAHRNPYFNMVVLDENDHARVVMDAVGAKTDVSRRQDAPPVYDMTTICYVASPDAIMNGKATLGHRVGVVHIPVERSIDIDTEYDLKIAEALLKAGRGHE